MLTKKQIQSICDEVKKEPGVRKKYPGFIDVHVHLREPFTAANLEGMFQLNFALKNYMIYWIIIAGGSVLLVLQYFIVYLSGILAFKHFK